MPDYIRWPLFILAAIVVFYVELLCWCYVAVFGKLPRRTRRGDVIEDTN